MEAVENIVIVGAGIAGLATALGLHRLGMKSVVLESADQLRTSGFALGLWTNAWRALDALGVGDKLRENHMKLQEFVLASASTGMIMNRVKFDENNTEMRGVMRNNLLDVLASELPQGTIRFGAKVVSIEEIGDLKLLHLADGSSFKTKVLVGCDGVNSIVAKWLGLSKPLDAARYAIRGLAEYPNGHGFHLNFQHFIGNGFRCGLVPSDDKYAYWFFTWPPSTEEEKVEQNPMKLKQFVLSKLGKFTPDMVNIVEKSDTSSIIITPLKFRNPLDLLWGHVYKDNVCLAGDAFHAMTPDIGQGGCSALEDSVTLARCLGNVFLNVTKMESDLIKMAIEKYVKERRWRCFELITTAYVSGWIPKTRETMIGFMRDIVMKTVVAKRRPGITGFDCGKLKLHQ